MGEFGKADYAVHQGSPVLDQEALSICSILKSQLPAPSSQPQLKQKMLNLIRFCVKEPWLVLMLACAAALPAGFASKGDPIDAFRTSVKTSHRV